MREYYKVKNISDVFGITEDKLMTIIIKFVLIIMAVFLIVAVLMQEGKSQGLGALGGNTESYLGKDKSKKSGKKLSSLTTIVAIVFVVVVMVLVVFEQRDGNYVSPFNPNATLTDSSFGADDTPEPTTTPTTTPTATPTAAPTVTPTVTPDATVTAEPTVTATPEATGTAK